MRIDKNLLLEKIKAQLAEELAFLTKAAKAAHDAATNEESKAEDQYDTRGLEASYLAGAQSQRAAEVQKTLALYQTLELKAPAAGAPIAATALVELESGGKTSLYFIAPYGAGMNLEIDGVTVHVITSQSPLGEELIGRKPGDLVEVELRNGVREYRIRSAS